MCGCMFYHFIYYGVYLLSGYDCFLPVINIWFFVFIFCGWYLPVTNIYPIDSFSLVYFLLLFFFWSLHWSCLWFLFSFWCCAFSATAILGFICYDDLIVGIWSYCLVYKFFYFGKWYMLLFWPLSCWCLFFLCSLLLSFLPLNVLFVNFFCFSLICQNSIIYLVLQMFRILVFIIIFKFFLCLSIDLLSTVAW